MKRLIYSSNNRYGRPVYGSASNKFDVIVDSRSKAYLAECGWITGEQLENDLYEYFLPYAKQYNTGTVTISNVKYYAPGSKLPEYKGDDTSQYKDGQRVAYSWTASSNGKSFDDGMDYLYDAEQDDMYPICEQYDWSDFAAEVIYNIS